VCVAHRTSIAHHSTSFQRKKKKKPVSLRCTPNHIPSRTWPNQAKSPGAGQRTSTRAAGTGTGTLQSAQARRVPDWPGLRAQRFQGGDRAALWSLGDWVAELVGGKREMVEMENPAERTTDLDLDMDLERERETSAEVRRPATECPHAAIPPPLPILTPAPACSTAALGRAGLHIVSNRLIYRPTTALGIQVRPALPCPHVHVAGAHARIPRPVRRSRCRPVPLAWGS
jgi:hypothetical protein